MYNKLQSLAFPVHLMEEFMEKNRTFRAHLCSHGKFEAYPKSVKSRIFDLLNNLQVTLLQSKPNVPFPVLREQ
jgi:hypothetical protein